MLKPIFAELCLDTVKNLTDLSVVIDPRNKACRFLTNFCAVWVDLEIVSEDQLELFEKSA